MYSKITNPKTGRKVSIDSRLGKRILRNYLSVLKGGGRVPRNRVGGTFEGGEGSDELGTQIHSAARACHRGDSPTDFRRKDTRMAYYKRGPIFHT